MVASTFLFITDEDNEEEEEEVPLKNRPSRTPRAGGWEDGALGEQSISSPTEWAGFAGAVSLFSSAQHGSGDRLIFAHNSGVSCQGC